MERWEWLRSEDPRAVLEHLTSERAGWSAKPPHTVRQTRREPLISERKLRLFCTACYALSYGHARAVSAEHGGYGHWDEGAADPGDPDDSPLGMAWLWCATNDVDRGEITRARKAALFRDMVDPFRPPGLSAFTCRSCGYRHREPWRSCASCVAPHPWLTPDVLAVARQAYDERPGRACEECQGFGRGHLISSEGHGSKGKSVFAKCKPCGGTGRLADGSLDPANLSVLADCLTDAGCDDHDLLMHLRGFERCWLCVRTGGGGGCSVCGSVTGEPSAPGWVPVGAPRCRGVWGLDAVLGLA